MALKTFTFRDGRMRLYDGTPVTPFYLEILFMDANFTGPLGRPRPEERSVMNRGKLRNNDNAWHYVAGPDTPQGEPLQLSFSFRLANTDPMFQKFRDAMNLDIAAAWTVGVNTWVTSKGKSQVLSGGQAGGISSGVVSVTTPTFTDPRKRCADVYVLWEDPDGVANIGMKWAETFFPPDQQSLNEGEDMVSIRCQGLIYGDVAEITAFPAGTAS